RVSEGMRMAFGKAVGTAARVQERQKIFTVYTTEEYVEKAKKALNTAGYKLPTPTRVIVTVKNIKA
ncbi:MAG: ribosomal protein L16, partial [Methanomicrobium sp.]|nr:ribosomal protein L16 [Methanomicrobium sp.]